MKESIYHSNQIRRILADFKNIIAQEIELKNIDILKTENIEVYQGLILK